MKQYKYFFLFFIIVVAANSFCIAQKTGGVAKIKGTLKGFPSVVEFENFSEIQHLVPKSYNQTITLSPDSSFEITIPLTAPCYFRLGRNKLYLSPGDNMNVVIDNYYPTNAIFKGKGSVANNFLSNAAFPKGGSFLEAGRNIQKTPEEMMVFIRKTAQSKEKELLALKAVSPEFVRLEKARIKADIIKTISSVNSYSAYALRKETPEFRESYMKIFTQLAQPLKDSILTNFVDPTLLQIEVYRDIVYKDLPLDKTKTTLAKAQIMNDWKTAYELAYGKIKSATDKSLLPAFKLSADSIKTKKYRDVVNLLIKEKMKFGTGDPAIDFTVRNPDGTTALLSSLKGKVIYVDVWATWCGPCLAAMPHLEELKKKYENNPNIAIVSLSVDDNDPVWLKNLNTRKPSGIQWRIDRAKLVDYGVETLPRYFLIDKKFTVANMNAAEANDALTITEIETLLK
jgi:thiol-disulfide isomerase/thioredoxin